MCYADFMRVLAATSPRVATVAFGLTALLCVGACGKSNDPPPDLIKTQRQAMERARAVSSVIEQQDQNSRKHIDHDSD
jgi:hypothetical protein